MLTSLTNRLNTFLLVLILAVGIGIVAMLASGARGGPLDPPGPPASTMHTLADTPPSWDQVLDSTNGAPGPLSPPAGCNSDRFKCVMTYAQCSGVCITVYPAVLDEETGLVWQRAPVAKPTMDSWDTANAYCSLATTGKRMGWRLPTLAELQSLVDPSTFGLPAGNPFSGVDAGMTSIAYWSSTEDFGSSPPGAWTYRFTTNGGVSNVKTGDFNVWCVRGDTSNR